MYKIAFLDRDGVINKSIKKKKYISEVKYFKLTAGLIKSIKYLKSLNYKDLPKTLLFLTKKCC